MLDSDKIYDFTIRFGEQTDTLDAEGKVIAASEVRPTSEQVEAVLPVFTGPIEQVPPIYSALKVDGERAYDLARAGEEVVLAKRAVTIHSLQLRHPSEGWDRVGKGERPVASDPSLRWGDDGAREEELAEITFTAHVSKGTYIRSLARDIALALGTVGHVVMLRRIKAGPFTLDAAISLDKLDEMAKAHALEHALLPLTAGLDDIPALPVSPDQAGSLRMGRKLIGIAATPGLHLAIDQNGPVALVEVSGPEIRVVRGFNL